MNYIVNYVSLFTFILCLISSSSESDRSLDQLFEELDALKKGIARGFSDQWNILHNIRKQGIKRHKGLLHVNRAIEKISADVERLKKISPLSCHKENSRNIFNDGATCKAPAVSIEDKCYLIKKKRLPFAKALSYCRSFGGTLADGRNPSELSTLLGYLNKEVGIAKHYMDRFIWVGGQHTDGSWMWIKRKGVHFASDKIDDVSIWAANEPRYKSVGNASVCIALDSSKGYKAVSVPCSHSRRFICAS